MTNLQLDKLQSFEPKYPGIARIVKYAVFDNVETSFCGPPPKPGVYAVCVYSRSRNYERVLYIGASMNVKKRILKLNHPYLLAFNRFDGWNFPVFTRVFETEDPFPLEKKLIEIYRPAMNKRGKGWQRG